MDELTQELLSPVAQSDDPTDGSIPSHMHGHGHGRRHMEQKGEECEHHAHGHGHGRRHTEQKGEECEHHGHGHGHGRRHSEEKGEGCEHHAHGHGHDGGDACTHGHHGHGHGSNKRTTTKSDACCSSGVQRLSGALVLCLLFAACELIGGYFAGSLAIMTDAAHLLSDVASFGVSIFAICMTQRPATYRYTFGLRRAEAVGTLVSILIIWLITGILIYQGIQRVQMVIAEPQVKHVNGFLMFCVACGGVVINFFIMCIFSASGHAHSHGGEACKHGHGSTSSSSMVEEAAYIHALGDTIQSFGVVVAGGLIWWKADGKDGNGWWQLADPISTFFFGVLVLYTTRQIFVNVINLFLMRSPESADMEVLVMNIQALPFVHSTHDFHAFQVASDFPILIGHIIFDDPQNNYDYTRMLKDIKGECLKKGIDHVTLQLEPLNGVEQLDCSCPVHGPDDMC